MYKTLCIWLSNMNVKQQMPHNKDTDHHFKVKRVNLAEYSKITCKEMQTLFSYFLIEPTSHIGKKPLSFVSFI